MTQYHYVTVMSKLSLTLEEGSVELYEVIDLLRAQNPTYIMKQSESYSDRWFHRFDMRTDRSNCFECFGLASDSGVIDRVKADIDVYRKTYEPIMYDETTKQLSLVHNQPMTTSDGQSCTWTQVQTYYNISPELGSQLMST